MKRFTLALAGAVLATGALAQEPLDIVFTHHSSASNPFWQAVQKGFDDACEKLDANCQMIFTQTEGSISEQSANMITALARQPDALITSIVDNQAFDQIISQARDNGVIVIASNVDDLEGADGNARQAFIGQGLVAAGEALGNAMIERFLPEEGPIKAVVGVSAPGQNWSEQRAKGITNALEAFKEANPDREIEITRLDTGTDGAIVAERVGSYLNANPHPGPSRPAVDAHERLGRGAGVHDQPVEGWLGGQDRRDPQRRMRKPRGPVPAGEGVVDPLRRQPARFREVEVG